MAEEMMTSQKTCRLLYYGPAGSGKRANLRFIHHSIPPEQVLMQDCGDPERQIAFRVNQGDDGTWQVRVQAVDAGEESHDAAGMPDEAPFDGIVFVIDSKLEQLDQSLAAFESLKSYLESFELDLTEVPVVIQYNGRDQAEILPVDRMESLLNPWGLLSFPANAGKGEGVRETLKSILGLTVNQLNQKPRSGAKGKSFPSPVVAESKSAPEAEKIEASGLGIDYGPPIPGSEIGESTKALTDAIFEELRPPVVVPVKIPRRLLTGEGPINILLEVEIDDNSPF
ncbi:MAG: hypothetical protein ABFS42_01595 [Candidatus Krumholzibacteriota bacterium]